MIELIRITAKDQSIKGTFGVLKQFSIPIAVTCEDPWNNNTHNISCIPEGTYQVQKYTSPHHTDVWQVMNVPDRQDILIHEGNTIKDSEGCILVGEGFGVLSGLPAILNSSRTLNLLRGILPDNFELTIRSVQ